MLFYILQDKKESINNLKNNLKKEDKNLANDENETYLKNNLKKEDKNLANEKITYLKKPTKQATKIYLQNQINYLHIKLHLLHIIKSIILHKMLMNIQNDPENLPENLPMYLNAKSVTCKKEILKNENIHLNLSIYKILSITRVKFTHKSLLQLYILSLIHI